MSLHDATIDVVVAVGFFLVDVVVVAVVVVNIVVVDVLVVADYTISSCG